MKRAGIMAAGLMLLSACTPTPDPEDQPAGFARLSGTVTLAAGSYVDSDSNDLLLEAISNDTPQTAQPVSVPAVITGFVGKASGSGHFSSSPDPVDYFFASLQGGQSIVLTIADWSDDPTIDLDLELYRVQDAAITLEAVSSGTMAQESLTVTESGDYLVAVKADSGGSNYILKLDGASATEHSGSLSSQAEFVPGQAITSRPSHSGAFAAGSSDTSDTSGSTELELINLVQTVTMAAAGDADSGYGLSYPDAQISPELAEKLQTLQSIRQLRRQGGYQYVEPNYIRRALSEPNDPLYEYQWHYRQIDLAPAWTLSQGDSPTHGPSIVAVIDTGVRFDHPDLAASLTADGYDFIADENNALDGDGIDNDATDPGDWGVENTSVLDSSWHGSHVAGTVAAVADNNEGGVGVAPQARVMPLRVLGKYGGTDYDIMQAVKYAAGLANDSATLPTRRADVINLSLGGEGYSGLFQQLVNEVRAQGVIVIAAAGNAGSTVPMYPAAYDGVVSVSSVDESGGLSYFSSYGDSIDLAAPGGFALSDQNGDGYIDGVISTAMVDHGYGYPVPGYVAQVGTSMAAPHVAGVAALMKALYPALTPAKFDELLQLGQLTSAQPTAGRNNTLGYGIVNAQLAAETAQALADGSLILPAVLSFSSRQLDLGYLHTPRELIISQIGDADLALTAISSSHAWLQVAESDVDGNKLGSYLLQPDVSALADGHHQAELRVEDSAGRVYTVPVSLDKGIVMQSSSLYIAIVDISNETVAADLLQSDSGRFSYRFDGIPQGQYQVVAGTDHDNDSYLCDPGELCGRYRSAQGSELLDLNGDRAGIDFAVAAVNQLLAASQPASVR